MAKKYNSTWNAQKLSINFNQKQWRQDFGAFVKEKLFWMQSRVSRAKSISNKVSDRGIKQFEVFDGYGQSILIKFYEENKVIDCTNKEILEKYFIFRNIK